jgi:hypothetical protein
MHGCVGGTASGFAFDTIPSTYNDESHPSTDEGDCFLRQEFGESRLAISGPPASPISMSHGTWR